MDILFLITGFIFALITPLLNYSILGFKGFIYSFIMILFAYIVLAYVILSIYKLKIAKIDYLKSKSIVSWKIERTQKETKLPYIISLISGVIFGIFVYLKNVGLLSSIFLSLACAFAVLGWWIMGIKRFMSKLDETDSFLLSHMGMIYKNEIEIFNGYSKGVTSAKREENTLILTLLKKKEEREIKIKIPEDKISEVDNFLNDLNDYFNGENNEG